ncbi:MAG: uroporphyrinogen decarboxylase [Gammaproteobacteria bacterium]|nr:uroporphyrinogen decarboxylase [Gammaproteobacteria bacterium]
MNDLLIRALLKQPVNRTPIWIMRQAGRYLPEYRETRKKAGDFLTLCKTPELACEVTLQPVDRFPLDAAILFSDILTIPDAMGLGLSVEEGLGPRLSKPIRCRQDIDGLGVPDPETELHYVMDTIRMVRRELEERIPLIGFAGSPWTLATYMIEGGSSKDFVLIKTMMYARPDELHRLLSVLADSVTNYLNAQIAAGVQAVMVFDTWGGVLSHRDYKTFSLNYMSTVVQGLSRRNQGIEIPVILFTKNGGQWLEDIAATGCSAVGIDWMTDLLVARQRIGERVALQGNMDPSVLHASPERIQSEVQGILQSYGRGSGHVFNLGHGIHPTTSPQSVETLVDAVHQLSVQYHAP